MGTFLEVAVILSVTITVANTLTTLVRSASERRALSNPITGLGQTVVRGGVYIIGLLVLLDALGIQITPILTALGVGGLAVALALQDTLSNLFAGVHLLADKPIRVGDYVKLADAVEGHVVDIGLAVDARAHAPERRRHVPNKRVAESIITNYDLPESRLALPIRIAVDYGADPDLVERILLEEDEAGVERGGARPPAGARAFRPTHSGLRRVLAGFHAHVPREVVHRPVPRPARSPQADLAAAGRREDRIPVQVRGVELRSAGGDART